MNDPSPTRTRIGIAAIALVTILAIGFTGVIAYRNWSQKTAVRTLPPDTSVVNQPRPEFSLPDIQGQPRTLSEWNGKVIAVNFWATWCAPCRREIPTFNELQKKYGPQGVQFLGIALDDPAAIKDYLKEVPIDYPVLVGGDGAADIARRYGNKMGVLPYTAILDRQGRIAFVHYGELSREMATNVIDSQL